VLGLLGIAFALGTTVALGASALVAPQTQARVVEAETTMFRVPGGPLAVAATALLVFAVVATAVVQRRADRANVAEVMRGAP
jgi:ABC-type antimicrobial peptide transport system permease subunit